MTFTQICNPIFEQVIKDYHLVDDVDQDINNPYENDYKTYLEKYTRMSIYREQLSGTLIEHLVNVC